MIKLSTLNEHISCLICKGYLIEATTIIECLHTFCRTCIVKHLKEHNTCPKCKQVIHQSHPLNYISFDRTMQDIVYKLVPSLERPKDNNNNLAKNESKNQTYYNENIDYHRNDEQINIQIMPHSSFDVKPLRRPYLRVSSLATVTHLKKFISLKLYGDADRYKEFDLLCNDNILGNDHNLKFISVTEWRTKVPPVIIKYRPLLED